MLRVMWKKHRWTLLWVLYAGFVFHNSMVPSDASSAQSGFVLNVMMGMLHGVGLGDVGLTEHIIRKTAHFAEYAVMGILMYQCLAQYSFTKTERRGLYALMGFLMPFVDETIQLFVTGRSGQISDVWLDAFGVAFGLLVILAAARIGSRLHSRERKGEHS